MKENIKQTFLEISEGKDWTLEEVNTLYFLRADKTRLIIDELINEKQKERDRLTKKVRTQTASDIEKRLWVGYMSEVAILNRLLNKLELI